jgi:hypothetical protein
MFLGVHKYILYSKKIFCYKNKPDLREISENRRFKFENSSCSSFGEIRPKLLRFFLFRGVTGK